MVRGSIEDVAAGDDQPGSTMPYGSSTTWPADGVGAPSLTAELFDGRYEIRGLVGRGGMGNVYRAWDTVLEEDVALKMLHMERNASSVAQRRFRAEVKLARRVTHKNVARTYDIGRCGELLYLTMEYIDGATLSELRDQGDWTVERAAYVMLQVCRGLQAAHIAGVIHRDLKPANIMITEDERVVITDFGIAYARDAGSEASATGLTGTPAYMAPEQIGSGKVDGRADVYAMGVILLQLVTGRLPWDATSSVNMIVARLKDPMPDLTALASNAPSALQDVLAKCLQVNPSARYASVLDVAADLAPLARAEPRPQPTLVPDIKARNRPDFGESADRTLAVLPLRARTEADALVADGLTEDLIDEFSMMDGIRVRPRGAVISYQGDVDPRSAGRELGVQVVLDGTVRSHGDQVQIRVGVTSVAEGFQVWAQRFRCARGEVFDVLDDIVAGLSEALRGQRFAAVRSSPTDPHAVDLYLRARKQMRLDWYNDLSLSVGLFEQALLLAPSDPRVLSGASIAQARSCFSDSSNRSEHVRLASELAGRAIQVAEDWPEPYFALAMVAFHSGAMGGAIRLLRETLRRAPDHTEAHEFLGQVFMELGPLEQAQEHLSKALVLNPELLKARWELARCHALRGNVADMDELLARPVSGEQFGIRDAQRSRFDLWYGRSHWREALLASDTGSLAPLATLNRIRRDVAHRGSLTDLERSQLGGFLQKSPPGSRMHLMLRQMQAELLAASGEDSHEALQNLVNNGLKDLMWLECCPLFEPYRQRPEHQRVVTQLRRQVQASLVESEHGASFA